MGAPFAQVGTAVALEGAVGAGAGADCDRTPRRPRLRVPDTDEARRHRAQLEPRPGRREHGTLELHIAEAPRTLLRPSGVLPHLQQQERRARRWSLPEEGRSRHAFTQKVSTYLPSTLPAR